MIQKIRFLSRAKASMIAYSNDQAIISICDPVQEAPNWMGIPNSVLELNFLDILPDCTYGEDFIFTEEDAHRVVNFVKNLSSDVTELIVHCHAGISRSAAVALYAQAETNATLESHETADLANTFVVEMLSHVSGLKIQIPAPLIQSWESAWRL